MTSPTKDEGMSVFERLFVWGVWEGGLLSPLLSVGLKTLAVFVFPLR